MYNAMNAIGTRIKELKSELPEGVELVAVSKFHPEQSIADAYEAGQRRFGESRVQELLRKQPGLPSDIEWHFIGHLQTNKVRQLVGKVSLIESVDTEHLLDVIDSESVKAGVVSRVLMQLHVAREETKFGFSPEELIAYFSEKRFESLRATHICGVMGMASNTDDAARVEADFRAIAGLRRQVMEMCPDLRGFDTVSMGMSGDYPAAIACGSNLVRIGTDIFGSRDY